MQESGMFFDLLMGGLAGLLTSLLFYAGLARKIYNLQCDLAITQAQLLKEKNSRAATIRHNDKASLELFTDLKQPAPPSIPRNPLAKFGVGR
jgi:hypothetical protein